MVDFTSEETPSDALHHVQWAAMRAARSNEVRSMKALDRADDEITKLRAALKEGK